MPATLGGTCERLLFANNGGLRDIEVRDIPLSQCILESPPGTRVQRKHRSSNSDRLTRIVSFKEKASLTI